MQLGAWLLLIWFACCSWHTVLALSSHGNNDDNNNNCALMGHVSFSGCHAFTYSGDHDTQFVFDHCAKVLTAYLVTEATGALVESYRFTQAQHANFSMSYALTAETVGPYTIVSGSATTLWVLNRATGSVLWNVSNQAFPMAVVGVSLSQDVLICGLSLGVEVMALRLSTGVKLWSSSAVGDGVGPGVMVGSRVVFGCGLEHVCCFNFTSGVLLWKILSEQNPDGVPSTDGSLVFIGAKRITAYDITNGTQVWRSGDSFSAITSRYRDGVVYEVGFGGNFGISARNATTGRKLWHVDGVVYAKPSTQGLLFYSNASLGELACSDGSLRWSCPIGASVADQGDIQPVFFSENKKLAYVPNATNVQWYRIPAN